MAQIAGNQGQFVGYGNGGDFKIGKGHGRAVLFQPGPQSAADVGGFGVKENDIDRREQVLFQVFEMMTRPGAFLSTINDFGKGNDRNVLRLVRCSG
jgi:hypothetical protein